MARSYVHEAHRRVGPKRDRIRPVVERLAAEHPDAVIALRFRDELQLLVSVMLSAQTTDVMVNRVTEKLFAKYRTPEDYLAVPLEELERDIKPTGTFRQKAKNLRGTMRLLQDEFDGEIPQRLGFTRKDDPAKIELDLQRLVPREDWARFPHLLIRHGRRICIARRPRCEDCVLADLCPSSRL